MKVLLFFAFLVVFVSGFVEEHIAKFEAFKVTHGKTYSNKAEESRRFAIFTENLKSIEEHNALYNQGKTTWKKGITRFTDWTDDEFKSMTASQQRLSLLELTKARELKSLSNDPIPDEIDWRKLGVVTEVKDQGNCASSYAFAVVGAVEAAHAQKTGKLVSLSAQQIVDCSSEVAAENSCRGGYMYDSFVYAQMRGLQSEENYPYNATTQTCQYNASAVVTKIDDTIYMGYNQYALKHIVGTRGPVGAGINGAEIRDYESGILDSESCGEYSIIDLSVLVVGYGTENGTNFWIVKNNWGTDWGEDGYIRILQKPNYSSCSLSRENVYPIIN